MQHYTKVGAVTPQQTAYVDFRSCILKLQETITLVNLCKNTVKTVWSGSFVFTQAGLFCTPGSVAL